LKETGTDQIEFLFSANKGSVLRPIKDQASGGELARFNLAVKSLISQAEKSSSLIFDEIDTGVSGQIALQMGNILKSMALHQQVICITHSPQVASRANQHLYVFKEHEGKKTNTRIKKLNQQERLHELAKMLSGEPPTKAALKNASELIEMV
jgi:DNA repair protein RecN (Recombination protein N)